MKAKNILMTLLLVTGAIAAKAAGYPPELALVSQPVMVYNANSITVYYDVENIGDYTYRGSVYLYLSPDEGYHYAREWVKVRPGRIKRIAIEIPAYRIRRSHAFTIMPYYEMHNELYSFTTFEYFEPITFYWAGPRNERWVVIHVGPCLRHYHRPGTYRYYYDGFRPPMHAHGPGMPPPPMDPMHHTYGYHKEHNWYPADHNGEAPKPNEHVGATVRPEEHAGSMSGGSTSSGSTSGKPSSTSGSVSGSTSRPASTNGSVSGSTSRPSGTSTSSSGSVSRPASSGSTSRPASTSGSVSGNTSRPSGTSTSSIGSVSRPSSSSTSSSGRSGSSSGTRSTGSSTRGSSTGSSGAGRR